MTQVYNEELTLGNSVLSHFECREWENGKFLVFKQQPNRRKQRNPSGTSTVGLTWKQDNYSKGIFNLASNRTWNQWPYRLAVPT